MSIEEAAKDLRIKIDKASKNSGLSTNSVTLLGASKAQSADSICQAIKAGIYDFGENRVQEAQDKWPEIKKAYPRVKLHLIGPLQSNKVKDALELFDVIQTVDRIKLADALAEAMQKMDKKIPCYIQVNTGDEPQKAGASVAEADALIDYCKVKLPLPIVGLMCVPPNHQPAAPHFALLRQIAQRHDLHELSMGMSDDFEVAVRMGSTCVRLGRALFGERA